MSGGRRVRVGGEILGIAYHLRDFQDFLRCAGAGPDAIDLADPDLIEWRGPAAGPGADVRNPPRSRDRSRRPPATGSIRSASGFSAVVKRI